MKTILVILFAIVLTTGCRDKRGGFPKIIAESAEVHVLAVVNKYT